MSTLCFGIIHLKNFALISEIKQVVVTATSTAKVGVQVEPHISQEIVRNFLAKNSAPTSLCFMLTDDSAHDTAQVLLGEDGVKQYFQNQRVDQGEALLARLQRICNFFGAFFSYETVDHVTLYITTGLANDQFPTIKTTICDFSQQIETAYTTANEIPNLKIIIAPQ